MTTPAHDRACSDGFRVLVVVGDPETRAFIGRVLEARHPVQVASDGQMALEAVGQSPPDLIILGRTPRPSEDLDYLRELRSRASGVPVLLLCCEAEEEGWIACANAGADDYLFSPFGARELLERVALQASRSRLRAAARDEARRQALRGSEARFRTFLSQSRDGVLIIDGEGTLLEWNEGEEKITGIPRAEATGRPLWEVQHRLALGEHRTPERLHFLRDVVLGALKEGIDLERTVEEEIERPDGARRFIESKIFAVRSGEHVLAGAITRDTTDRRRLEESLREREALLRETERLVSVGHFTRDLRTGEALWSDEVYRILGYEPGALSADRDALLAAIVPEDRARIAEALEATARDGLTRRDEFRVNTTQGQVRALIATVALLRDADGAPGRLIGTVQDITERKMMEEALEDASRRKDEFLAILSHELRNPLAPVRSSLHVLARTEPGSEKARAMLAVIERQITHLDRLVDDLLDVTRIGRGKIQLLREPIELGALVGRTVEDHRGAFAAAGLQLEGQPAIGALWLTGDPTRLSQIIGNLLTNAVKFTPRGGRVALALERDGDWAVLRVHDSGVGIPSHMLERIFEPFIQADQTLERARGGLGLGLALVKGLAELHGGSVSVASEGAGLGAEFTVRLPLQAGAEEAAPAPEGVGPAPPRRVLVIEDSIDAANALKAALEVDGHEVEVAYDGPEGIAKARVFCPDVVLCDIGLPGMDGYAVARAFEADDALRGAFLVALTGYALPEDVQRAQEAGFHRHLAKPPCFERLEALLAQAPDRRREAAAAGPPQPLA